MSKEMWDALCSARPWLLWAKERGALCGDVIADVERQIKANRATCAPAWSQSPQDAPVKAEPPAPAWVACSPENRPEIVCLCGSTRFKEAFERETRRLGLEGKIVLSVSMFGHSGDLKPEECADGHPTKAKLDQLHKHKIDLADRVLVLNCLRPRCSACGHWQTVRMSNDGLSNCCMKPLVDEPYIGDSTRSEIEHAAKRGKPIDYLNAHAPASPAIPDEQQPATRPAVD